MGLSPVMMVHRSYLWTTPETAWNFQLRMLDLKQEQNHPHPKQTRIFSSYIILCYFLRNLKSSKLTTESSCLGISPKLFHDTKHPQASLIHLSLKEKQPLQVSSVVLWGLRLPPHKIFKHLLNFKQLNSDRAQSSNTKMNVQSQM